MNTLASYAQEFNREIQTPEAINHVKRNAVFSFVFSLCLRQDLNRAFIAGGIGGLISLVDIATKPIFIDISSKLKLHSTFGKYRNYLFSATNIALTNVLLTAFTNIRINLIRSIAVSIIAPLLLKEVFGYDVGRRNTVVFV